MDGWTVSALRLGSRNDINEQFFGESLHRGAFCEDDINGNIVTGFDASLLSLSLMIEPPYPGRTYGSKKNMLVITFRAPRCASQNKT